MAEDTGPNHARHESPIRKLIFESALIVFSILLALAANQWNDARKQRALVNRALAADARRRRRHGIRHGATLSRL